jgi:PST family polysaccharide transporter
MSTDALTPPATPENSPAETILVGSPGENNVLTAGAQLTGGSLQMLTAQALNVPLGVLTNALLTRTLGPELFGLLVLAGGISAWFEVFVVRTLGRTSIRLIATAEDWMDTASQFLQIQLITGIAGGLGLFICAPLIAAAISAPNLTPFLRIAALELPIAALARLQESALIGRKKFGGRAIMMGAHGLIRLGLVFALLNAGLSLTGALLANVGAAAVQFLIARILLPVPVRLHRSLPWRAIGSYAVPLLLYTVAISLFQNTDILLVKLLNTSPDAPGYYGAAETLMSMAGMISTAVSPLLLAVLTGLWHRGDRSGAQAVIGQAVRLHLILLPFMALAAGSSGDIIRFLYGEAYAPAAPIMQWLVFAGLASMLHSTMTASLTAIGEPGLTFRVTAPMLPLLVIAAIIVHPLLGLVGIAMCTTLVIAAGSTGAIALLAWKSGARLPWASLVRMSLISVAAFWLGGLGEIVLPASGALLIARLAGLCVVIVGLMFITFEVRASEVRTIGTMIGQSFPQVKRLFEQREPRP